MSGKGLVVIAFLAGAAAGATAWWFRQQHPEASRVSVSISRPLPDPVMSRVISAGPMARPRDFFRCITLPKYLAAAEAGESMSDDEVVIGLEIDGDCRAYPINYLNEHEMVQDEIGGLPVLVTW